MGKFTAQSSNEARMAERSEEEARFTAALDASVNGSPQEQAEADAVLAQMFAGGGDFKARQRWLITDALTAPDRTLAGDGILTVHVPAFGEGPSFAFSCLEADGEINFVIWDHGWRVETLVDRICHKRKGAY